MDKPSAKVIAHSKAPNGEELITLEIELHRFVLPEFNTHRVFSRNFQSSRAVPVDKIIEQVRTNPAMPIYWGKNQRGMVAEEENTSRVYYPDRQTNGLEEFSAKEAWLNAAYDSAEIASYFHDAGYHKQIVNRLLEPYMWTKGVVTATEEGFNSFFKLRCHKDAQPEIRLLAERMGEAIESSTPEQLTYGEYHLPYLRQYVDSCGNTPFIDDAVKISSSCCAQVSYRTLDNSLEKAKRIYEMLNLPINGVYPEDPPHYSPTEHIAKVVDYNTEFWDCCEHRLTTQQLSGNFNNSVFWQYRKALESGMEREFLDQ